jgi:hypothetical protein
MSDSYVPIQSRCRALLPVKHRCRLHAISPVSHIESTVDESGGR